MADEHPIGQWVYRPAEGGGLERRRIGYKPVWERYDAPAVEKGQTLIPGVEPVTDGDRLGLLAVRPLAPVARQRSMDEGLFDLAARGQHQLF